MDCPGRTSSLAPPAAAPVAGGNTATRATDRTRAVIFKLFDRLMRCLLLFALGECRLNAGDALVREALGAAGTVEHSTPTTGIGHRADWRRRSVDQCAPGWRTRRDAGSRPRQRSRE